MEALYGRNDLQKYEKDTIYNFHHQEGTWMNSTCWTQGLIQKLLKATHRQWIYRNIQIHDAVAGTQATLRKEATQREMKSKWN
jgi:hypothetical protein